MSTVESDFVEVEVEDSDNDFIDNLSGSNDEDGDWEDSGEEKLSNGKDFFAKDTDKSCRRRNDVEGVSHRNTERKGKSVIGKDNSASKVCIPLEKVENQYSTVHRCFHNQICINCGT